MGIRADGQLFLGAFFDDSVVRDIGFGAMYNFLFAARYSGEGAEGSFDSSQAQWRGELIYRISFAEAPMVPTLLLRIGYGTTTCHIDTDVLYLLSVGYAYPYGALDIHLMLAEPWVRLFVSGGHLFTVFPGNDLSGRGTGYVFMGGVEAALFDLVLVGVAYDVAKFVITDHRLGETSDTYKTFFVRVGWLYQ
jgi:hypothetical protein